MRLRRLAALIGSPHVVVSAAAIILIVGLLGALVAVALGSSEWVAQSLAPPLYPGSVAIQQTRQTGASSASEFSFYETADSLQQVMQFLTPRYGTFTHNGRMYWSSQAGYSPLNALDLAGHGQHVRPSSIVTLEADPTSGQTLITVTVTWPIW